MPVLIDYTLYYPDRALERGLEGTVIVSLIITEDGRPEDVRIATSSGFVQLDSAAVRTAQTFVFAPPHIDNKPVRSFVHIPVEFQLQNMDFDTWIAEVIYRQGKISRENRKEDIAELYQLYKMLVYSTRFDLSTDINYYIKEAVLDTVASLWDGCWDIYPATSILFIDIIYRYPESFTSIRAEADFNRFFKSEALRIHYRLIDNKAYTLINRLYAALKH